MRILSFFKKHGIKIFLGFVTCFAVVSIVISYTDKDFGTITEKINVPGECNVGVIRITGDIIPFAGANADENGYAPVSTDPDYFSSLLNEAVSDPAIKGILLRIDSAGGTPAASSAIAHAVKSVSLPSVALIREMGLSGAYLVASGAQTIIASPYSDVGSIGVSMSYLDTIEKNRQEGLAFVPLASAPYKDYGNPNKPLSKEERILLERDLKIYHSQFVEDVAKNRNLTVEEVSKLADGSSMPGKLALEHKLVDALGDEETARQWFAERFELDAEEVSFCEFNGVTEE